MKLIKSLFAFIKNLFKKKTGEKPLTLDQQRQKKIQDRIEKCKASGSMQCPMCNRMSGVHRITLIKVVHRKTKKKVYICEECVGKMAIELGWKK